MSHGEGRTNLGLIVIEAPVAIEVVQVRSPCHRSELEIRSQSHYDNPSEPKSPPVSGEQFVPDDIRRGKTNLRQSCYLAVQCFGR